MGKQLIFAVAGSGKTTKILNSIQDYKRPLIITYTNENLKSLQANLMREYGHVPDHIYLRSYFSFLYTFCFRPFFSYKLRDNSYTWHNPKYYRGAPAKNDISHYMTKGRYLYANRVSKFILDKGAIEKVVHRLEKHFNCLLIDEVQDFAANDFNFILALSKANIDILCVGDFYQHTFDTSRDGNIRTNLHKKGADSYLKEFENAGYGIDTESLEKTHRCSPAVCEFISSQIGIPIYSHRNDVTSVVVVKDENAAHTLFHDDTKVKLFYQDHSKYACYSNNWGKSKGLNKYGDVCVVLNPTSAKLFEKGQLSDLAESTRNKLYVACSRARGNLYILDEQHLKKFKEHNT